MVSVTNWPISDPQALAELLELHVSARPTILDCTYGKGIVWGRLPIRQSVIKVDIQPLPGLDLVADWRDLPQHYPRGSIDCLVWDPIHVANVGKTSQFYDRYVAPQNPVNGDSVSYLFPGFLEDRSLDVTDNSNTYSALGGVLASLGHQGVVEALTAQQSVLTDAAKAMAQQPVLDAVRAVAAQERVITDAALNAAKAFGNQSVLMAAADASMKDAQRAFLSTLVDAPRAAARMVSTRSQHPTAPQAPTPPIAASPREATQRSTPGASENARELRPTKTISVYVRKGTESRERWLSFNLPEDIPQSEILDKGLAIDGNQALWDVSGEYDANEKRWSFTGPFATRLHAALPAALADEQQQLSTWLKERGYQVIFS